MGVELTDMEDSLNETSDGDYASESINQSSSNLQPSISNRSIPRQFSEMPSDGCESAYDDGFDFENRDISLASTPSLVSPSIDKMLELVDPFEVPPIPKKQKSAAKSPKAKVTSSKISHASNFLHKFFPNVKTKPDLTPENENIEKGTPLKVKLPMVKYPAHILHQDQFIIPKRDPFLT